MIKTEHHDEIARLLIEKTLPSDVIVKLGLPDDDEGWDEVAGVMNVLEWIDEHEYKAMLRSDR